MNFGERRDHHSSRNRKIFTGWSAATAATCVDGTRRRLCGPSLSSPSLFSLTGSRISVEKCAFVRRGKDEVVKREFESLAFLPEDLQSWSKRARGVAEGESCSIIEAKLIPCPLFLPGSISQTGRGQRQTLQSKPNLALDRIAILTNLSHTPSLSSQPHNPYSHSKRTARPAVCERRVCVCCVLVWEGHVCCSFDRISFPSHFSLQKVRNRCETQEFCAWSHYSLWEREERKCTRCVCPYSWLRTRFILHVEVVAS